MKNRIITALMALLMVAGMGLAGQAQVKIGYTNIELILAYMPKAKQVDQQLGTYQKKLTEKIQTKEKYAQARLQEYLEKKEKGELTPDTDKAAQQELQKLDQEIQKDAADAEEKLLSKREELLLPVLEELQTAIDNVAKETGYTYVLNQTTSTGVSTILFGPEEDDLTEKIMLKLGVQIPKAAGSN